MLRNMSPKLLVLTLALTAGCSQLAPRHHYLHKEEQPHASKWGYEGDIGPSHWGDLNPAYHLARDGDRQSPIDLANAVSTPLPELELDYQPVAVNLLYNGHSVQENERGDSHLRVADEQYKLEQFHFHSPSEHTVNGKSFAMELHFVHESADGVIAVVGVLIEEGRYNPAFDGMWAHLPDSKDTTEQATKEVMVADLLPQGRGYFGYSGSFTTPPCTEGVRWFVMSDPVQLSREQIATFRKVIYHNNRPVQVRNNRRLSRSR
jgi:carbonic anhydrase